MNKIVAIVIVLAVVVGGYFLYSNSQKNSSKDEVKSENTEAPIGKKMAFSEFMKQGGSFQCTVTQNANETTVVGSVYLNNGEISGEFSSSYNGADMNINTIVKDGFAYTWTSAMPTMGFKSKANASVNNAGASSGAYNWNESQIGEYDCTPWIVDATKFTIPTTVKFTEVK